MKTGMDLDARSENRCGKWSEIGSGFGDRGGTPPPEILRSTPSPPVIMGNEYPNQSKAFALYAFWKAVAFRGNGLFKLLSFYL